MPLATSPKTLFAQIVAQCEGHPRHFQTAAFLLSTDFLEPALPGAPALCVFLVGGEEKEFALVKPHSSVIVPRDVYIPEYINNSQYLQEYSLRLGIHLILSALCFLGFTLTFIEQLLCFRHCVSSFIFCPDFTDKKTGAQRLSPSTLCDRHTKGLEWSSTILQENKRNKQAYCKVTFF